MSAAPPVIPALADLTGRALALGWPLERITALCSAIPPSLDLSAATVWYSRASEADAPVRHVAPSTVVDITPDSITLTGPNSRWRAYRALDAYPVLAPRAQRAQRAGNGAEVDTRTPPPPAGDTWRRLHDPEPAPTIGCTPWGAHALAIGWPEAEVFGLERALGPNDIVIGDGGNVEIGRAHV